jgi:hypothetical protein
MGLDAAACRNKGHFRLRSYERFAHLAQQRGEVYFKGASRENTAIHSRHHIFATEMSRLSLLRARKLHGWLGRKGCCFDAFSVLAATPPTRFPRQIWINWRRKSHRPRPTKELSDRLREFPGAIGSVVRSARDQQNPIVFLQRDRRVNYLPDPDAGAAAVVDESPDGAVLL